MAISSNFQTGLLDLVNDITTAETATIANAIFEKSFVISKFNETHTVVTGVREGNVVPILSTNPSYTAFPYKDPTNCETPECDLTLGFGAKKWQLGMIACKIPICINTFDENFLAFWQEYKRLSGDANLDGALMKFIIERFQNNLDAAIWRTAWFGERGLSPSDPNYALLRPIDGIFTQAEAGDGVKMLITENTSGTAGTSVIPTGEAIYNYLNAAYLKAVTTPWFNPATLQFEMTAAMAGVWVGWLNSLTDRSMYNCECYSADGVTSMRSFDINGQLKAFGIPIIVRREFDGVINALQLSHPYRALLTSKDNIIIGTSETDQLPEFKVWYSQDDEKVYIKGGANFGATLVTDEYVYIGAETASVDDIISVALTPATASNAQSTTRQFTAAIEPATAPQGITWSISAGTGLSINSSGLVTIGASTPAGNYTVTAKATGDLTKQRTAVLTVTV